MTKCKVFLDVKWENKVVVRAIAKLSVHPVTSIAELTGLNPVQALIFYQASFPNCLN